jgi:hypothetical protein
VDPESTLSQDLRASVPRGVTIVPAMVVATRPALQAGVEYHGR